jgi:hypothetical protein
MDTWHLRDCVITATRDTGPNLGSPYLPAHPNHPPLVSIPQRPAQITNRPISTSTCTPQSPTSSTRRCSVSLPPFLALVSSHSSLRTATTAMKKPQDVFLLHTHALPFPDQPQPSSTNPPAPTSHISLHAPSTVQDLRPCDLCYTLPFAVIDDRFIAARGSPGHHLFIPAFMMASRSSAMTPTPTSPGVSSVSIFSWGDQPNGAGDVLLPWSGR